MKKKIKKILVNLSSDKEYHYLDIPKLKNYIRSSDGRPGRLTITKIYLNADKRDHNKKIKKNDPLVELALYDKEALKGKSAGEIFFGEWSDRWLNKAEKILITSPVSAIFKYRGDKMAYQNFSLGEIYKQEETFVLLALTSEDKKKNKAEAKKFSGKAQPIY